MAMPWLLAHDSGSPSTLRSPPLTLAIAPALLCLGAAAVAPTQVATAAAQCTDPLLPLAPSRRQHRRRRYARSLTAYSPRPWSRLPFLSQPRRLCLFFCPSMPEAAASAFVLRPHRAPRMMSQLTSGNSPTARSCISIHSRAWQDPIFQFTAGLAKVFQFRSYISIHSRACQDLMF